MCIIYVFKTFSLLKYLYVFKVIAGLAVTTTTVFVSLRAAMCHGVFDLHDPAKRVWNLSDYI